MSGSDTHQSTAGGPIWPLLGVLALGLALRLLCARFHLVGGDMVNSYYVPVLALLGGSEPEFQGWDQWHLRLGVIAPLAFFHWLTGSAATAVPLAALPFSVVQIALVYAIGRLVWDARVGLLAGLLEAVYPVSVVFGARILPDTPMACFATAAMLCYLAGHRHGRGSLFLLAGGCIGLGYTAKLTALFLIVILAGLCWLQRRDLTRWSAALIGLGAVGALLLETVALSLLNGGFHFRPWALVDTSGQYAGRGAYVVELARYLPGFFAGLYWPLNSGFAYHGLLGLAVPVALVGLWRRSGGGKAFTPVAWWWLGLLLLLNFACLGWARPVVYTLQMRYLMFATPPACLLIAAALARLGPRLRRRVTAALVVSSLGSCWALYSTWQPHEEAHGHIHALIQDRSADAARVFFHDRLSAWYARLVVGGERSYVLVERRAQLQQARSGDLAVVMVGGYVREERVPAGYREQLSTGSWRQIDDWQTESGLATVFRALRIPIKKGLQKRIQVYQHGAELPPGREASGSAGSGRS